MTQSARRKWRAIWRAGASLARRTPGENQRDAGRRSEVVMRRTRLAAGAVAVLALAAIVEPRYHAADIARRSSRPVDFIANRGQWDRRIDFAVRHGSASATV